MKKLIILALLLIGGVVQAQSLVTLDSMRVATWRQLGQPDIGNSQLDSATVATAINRAIQFTSANFPAVEVIDTIATTADSTVYAIASTITQFIWCYDEEYKKVSVFTLNDHVFFSVQKADGSTYFLAYNALGTKLETDTSTTDIRPDYREAVVTYACYLLSISRGRMDDAFAFLSQYERMIAMSKQE